VRILAPTYNEYAAILSGGGWTIEQAAALERLAGADLAIVVNPNNPDGRQHDPAKLLALLPHVGRLVVDESFADSVPGLSLAPEAGRPGLIVLRSFGKFHGLAGLRLGFVLGSEADVAAFAGMSGPWPVSGPAIEIGRRALLDRDWADETRARLVRWSARLDRLTKDAGWTLVGGTPLFRLYETGDAGAAQERLAEAKIWSRIFANSPGWLRLGLPGGEAEWERFAAALII
jgi:cobalamin biosynthetic protein CobC